MDRRTFIYKASLGTFIGLGYAFSDEVISVLVYARGLGIGLLVALVSVLAVYLALKIVRRRRSGGHTALGLGMAPTASGAPPIVVLDTPPTCGSEARRLANGALRVSRREAPRRGMACGDPDRT